MKSSNVFFLLSLSSLAKATADKGESKMNNNLVVVSFSFLPLSLGESGVKSRKSEKI